MVRATTPGGVSSPAYEIHLGVTTLPRRCRRSPGSTTASPTAPAAIACVGTYLHGAFEDAGVCAEVFGVPVSAAASKAAEHAALARWFGAHAEHPETWLP